MNRVPKTCVIFDECLTVVTKSWPHILTASNDCFVPHNGRTWRPQRTACPEPRADELRGAIRLWIQ